MSLTDAIAANDAKSPRPAIERAVVAVGSLGLLIAMMTDALAVLGRHLGVPVFGAIEIVQAAIVMLASGAIVYATLTSAHARVRIVLARSGSATRSRLLRVSGFSGALVFSAIAAGDMWIARDLWGQHEISEVLHLPIGVLRWVWIASALFVAGRWAVCAVGRESAE